MERDEPAEPGLRAELLEMSVADQAERTGKVVADNDASRTERLREIIDEYGWPTNSLVGSDGAFAAWLIAQHSDHDVEFQRQALELMTAAEAAGEANRRHLAYLVDRVKVNSGQPQVYGTQITCVSGQTVPRPIADEELVHERRAELGMEPLDDYLARLGEICSETHASTEG